MCPIQLSEDELLAVLTVQVPEFFRGTQSEHSERLNRIELRLSAMEQIDESTCCSLVSV